MVAIHDRHEYVRPAWGRQRSRQSPRFNRQVNWSRIGVMVTLAAFWSLIGATIAAHIR